MSLRAAALPLLLAALLAAVPAEAGQGRGQAADLRELKQKLGDGEERTRREAVQELAKLGEGKAWELVIDALGDPSPMVADEAQLALGGLRDAGALEALLGRDGLGAKNALVRLRAAEAVGRVTGLELDPDALVKALKAREPEVRRAVLWSVERHPIASRLEERSHEKLRKAIERVMEKDKDPGVRAAAVSALLAIGGVEVIALAPAAVMDEEPAVRSAGVRFADRLPREIARPVVKRGLGDASVAVRTQAVEACVSMADRWALEELVARLAEEQEELLVWRVVDGLRHLTGLRHSSDPRPWSDWIATLPETWAAAVKRRDASAEVARPPTTAAFHGLAIRSRRVVFLFDFSGSLWEERAGGRTRKQVLDEELKRTLEALPEDTRFNLVPYTDLPFAWKKELVPATEKNVAEALDWFVGLSRSGKGDFWGALMHALEDPEVDNVVAFTDGRPTGGERWNLELMVGLWAEHDRFRRVVLHAVVVDAAGWIGERWQELCEASGGRALAVELD